MEDNKIHIGGEFTSDTVDRIVVDYKEVRGEGKTLKDTIGQLSDLNTDNKDNVVAAINSISGSVGDKNEVEVNDTGKAPTNPQTELWVDMIEDELGTNVVEEADKDDKIYARQNGLWKDITNTIDTKLDRLPNNSLGYKVIPQGDGILRQADINEPNTIYEIRYDFDLGDLEVNIPEGCTLKFEGGCLKNGSICGNGTNIIANIYDYILKNNINIEGTWNVEKASICWFGAKSSLSIDKDNWTLINKDCSIAFNKAMNTTFHTIYVPTGFWYISSTIIMYDNKSLLLDGERVQCIGASWMAGLKIIGGGVVYTNKPNLTMLRVVKSVYSDNKTNPLSVISIVGGLFDTYEVLDGTYNAKVIDITLEDGLDIEHLTIKTSIMGNDRGFENMILNQSKAISIHMPNGKKGFIGHADINCIISQYHTGISVKKEGGSKCYANTIVDNSTIVSCIRCIDTNAGDYCTWNGAYQAVTYDNQEKADKEPLLSIGGLNNKVTGSIWDVGIKRTITIPSSKTLYYTTVGIEQLPSAENLYISPSLLEILLYRGSGKSKIKGYQYGNLEYSKYVCTKGVLGYNDLNNFFVLDGSFNVSAEYKNCKIRESGVDKIENVFIPGSTGFLLMVTDENPELKLTIDINSDTYGYYPNLLLLGTTMQVYKVGYFKEIEVKCYNNTDSLTPSYTNTINVYSTGDASVAKRFYSSLESLWFNIKKIEIIYKSYSHSDIGSLGNVQIYDIVGKCQNRSTKYITKAGGEIFGDIYLRRPFLAGNLMSYNPENGDFSIGKTKYAKAENKSSGAIFPWDGTRYGIMLCDIGKFEHEYSISYFLTVSTGRGVQASTYILSITRSFQLNAPVIGLTQIHRGKADAIFVVNKETASDTSEGHEYPIQIGIKSVNPSESITLAYSIINQTKVVTQPPKLTLLDNLTTLTRVLKITRPISNGITKDRPSVENSAPGTMFLNQETGDFEYLNTIGEWKKLAVETIPE